MKNLQIRLRGIIFCQVIRRKHVGQDSDVIMDVNQE